MVCVSVALVGAARPRVEYLRTPLSFEANEGQADGGARFVSHNRDYSLKLDSSGARFQGGGGEVRMTFQNAAGEVMPEGRLALSGKANYFPTGDRRAWITNIPTFERVHYGGIYAGVDVDFYGTAGRLEYDVSVKPGADPEQIRLKISGTEAATLNSAGDLELAGLSFRKPVAYQVRADGKARDAVEARYRIDRDVVTFELGKYDHARRLVIDPVVDALSYSQYLSEDNVAAVAVDAAGYGYVTGSGYTHNTALYISKFSPTGSLIYTASFGQGGNGYPTALAVDSSGIAYVTGQIYTRGTTIPTTANAYQAAPGTPIQEVFLAVLSASGSSLPYCSYLGGNDSKQSNAYGLAVDGAGGVYLAGETQSSSFPTTAGAYQTGNSSGFQTGWVAKIDTTKSGIASLAYSTLLGSQAVPGTQINSVAVDYAGNAYLAAFGAPNYPVTSGAFQYTGLSSSRGGAYVTKLNPTGTALVYSAYLGYGSAFDIAVENATAGLPSAYVTGTVLDADFPTSAGAYQTSYASGFAVKLSGDGSGEIYSTFLSGPSGYDGSAVDQYPNIALPRGCAAACNAYIAGATSSSDFPVINAIQEQPASPAFSAFFMELNATGTGALLSSYLSGWSAEVYKTTDGQRFGKTPAIAVAATGNIYIAGNTTSPAQSSDFPATSAYSNGNSQGFLARINASATAGFTLAQPTSINFGNQPIGVASFISTIRLSNFSGAPVTGLNITTTPGVFSQMNNCNGAIAAGSFCSLNVTFTPNSATSTNGTITISSNASNSPIKVSLTGTGYGSAYLEASSSNLTFASQAVGATSAAQSLTITNIGNLATAVTTIPNSANFLALNNCPALLSPGSSCTVSVTFAPSAPGLSQANLNIGSSNGGALYVPLLGTGVVPGATTSLTLSTTALPFNVQPISTTSGGLMVSFTNTGNEAVVINSYVASGNFEISGYPYGCGPTPYQLNPQATCQVEVTFSPTSLGMSTGTLAINDNVSGSPQTVALMGTGVANTQTVGFEPSSSLSFPDTPQGATSGAQRIFFVNTGAVPITVNRSVVSGDFSFLGNGCQGVTIQGFAPDGTGNASKCEMDVLFTPTATGARSGTITFFDSATGSPHVVQLQGTGITATSSVGVFPASINFANQGTGVTSGTQGITFSNTGNSNITVNSATFSGAAAGDFSIGGWASQAACQLLPCTIAPNAGGVPLVQFTPTALGVRTATLTLNTTAGSQPVTLTGSGVAAAAAIGFTPTSMNLGTVVVGKNGVQQSALFIRNTGTEIVNFGLSPTISGPNAKDFSISTTANCAAAGYNLQVNASCAVNVQFAASISGPESATITFTDTAGTQSIAMTGTGVSAAPAYAITNYQLPFDMELQGTVNPAYANSCCSETFTDNGAQITMGNVSVTGPFLVRDGCAGQTLNPVGVGSATCTVNVGFAPTTAGYMTGTLTFNGVNGAPIVGAPVVPLAGYSIAPVDSAYINPAIQNFTAKQVVGSTSTPLVTYLINNGTTPFTVGVVNGTDLGSPPTAEFGPTAGCNHMSVPPGGNCAVTLPFTPNAVGTRSGTINFPITYLDGSTATISGSMTGTGVAEYNSAVLTPPNATFIDQALGSSSPSTTTVFLNNNGNQPFTVGTLANTNGNEFSTSMTAGGDDVCSGASIQPGHSCFINVRFVPAASGSRAGTITFPVTFADKTMQNLNLPMSGTGVASAKTILISPANVVFTTEIEGSTTAPQQIQVWNTGNVPFNIGTDAITGNPAEFQIVEENCSGRMNFNSQNYCMIDVAFTPAANATGLQTGVLTIADGAAGGPHTVTLSGTAITAAQQVVVTPSTLAFGSQPAGSASTAQMFSITNQGDSAISIGSIKAGGANPSDFIISSQCGGVLNGHTSCLTGVQFVPPAGTTGALSAMITETDSGSTGSHIVTLTGTAVAPGPAATFYPSQLTFAQQSAGTNSVPQNFSITNTGSANLIISAVTSTNPGEFPIVTDGCLGMTVTPGQHCVVGVQFSPSLGGTRAGLISVTDNAGGSPQSLALSGTGYGFPLVSVTPASLTIGGTNVGSSSVVQSVSLQNTGTDTLVLSSIGVTGANASEFTQSNNCGTLLAPGTACGISVTFTPNAMGSRTAAITLTDNANNVNGSTQNVPVSGVGTGAPNAVLSTSSVTFPTQTVGARSAAQTLTLSNSGGSVMTISSVVVSGANPADFAETNNCGTNLAAGASCTIGVTFDPAATGLRGAALTVTDNSGGIGGSAQSSALSGTAIAPGAVAVVSLAPNSGSGMTQTFTGVYSDSSAIADLNNTGILVNTANSAVNACYVIYYPRSNALYLENDAGNGWLGPIAPGSAATLSNSQCSLSGAGSTVTSSGNNLTVGYSLTFTSAFTGPQNIYMSAKNLVGTNTGGVLKGSWTP